MERPVIIFGTGGLAQTALNIFVQNEVLVYGFLSESEEQVRQTINEVLVVGTVDDESLLRRTLADAEVFVALEDTAERIELTKTLLKQYKKMPINAIHRSAQLPHDLHIGHGNLIGAGVNVGPAVRVGNHCIIQSGSQLLHQVEIGDGSYVGAGAIIGARVKLGQEVFVGSGVVVGEGIRLGDRAKAGAGAVVVRHVKAETTVWGNPAQEI
ncbi:MAG: DapH/DapD/GlmU-related protein [Bernardetiaceae bacterium]